MEMKLESFNPSNGKLLGKVTITSIEEVQNVVMRSCEAARNWKNLKIDERLDLMKKAYEQAKPHIRDMAELLSQEMGKDIQRAAGEVSGTVLGGPYIAEEAKEALQSRLTGSRARIEYRPLGVAAVISPWNYPLAMANNLIVPSLMAGNTVVFKPSEETPLVADTFVRYLQKVLPENVLQIIHGNGEQGRALVESDVHLIAFTGSMAVGKDIMARASGGLKRLIMELGGNDPMIVLKDADMDAAVRFAVASSFENAGQMCIATERIYVDEKIADTFEQSVVSLASRYRPGSWNMPGANIGPIINSRQHEKIIEHIRDAEEKGARVLLGGSQQEKPYIKPTVIADITPEMIMEKEETFGPVVAISRYKTVDEAVERANDSVYGLGAVVFGRKDVEAVADRLEAGMVGINQGVGAGDAPWVGAKQSGFGFHGTSEGHRQFAQVRVMNY
ncbi:aldehyde dehydrogenase family protein [Desulfobacterales bacterium HSG16]|nr:aldehyde dehydrogenase family protein [Desulfobacterales bacterium HSG16]